MILKPPERYINKKNGNEYTILKRNVINATNGHEQDNPMILYISKFGEIFVRDEKEFEEKFYASS